MTFLCLASCGGPDESEKATTHGRLGQYLDSSPSGEGAATLELEHLVESEPLLDLSRSRIQLGPETPVTDLRARVGGGFQLETFVESLGDLLSDPIQSLVADPTNGYLEESAPSSMGRSIRLDPANGRFLVRDLLHPIPVSSAVVLDDETLRQQALLFMSALSVDAKESTFDVRELRRASRSVGSEGTSDVAIAKKVFVRRQIGGVPVTGDEVVITFTPAGAFRKILGRWPTINYEKSRFSTPLTTPEIVRRALERMSAADWDRGSVGRLLIQTAYERDIKDPGVIELRASVVGVPISEDFGKTLSWDFAIDAE